MLIYPERRMKKKGLMKKVFVVQELKRFHCPKCDSTYTAASPDGGFRCKHCNHQYEFGVAKPRDSLTEAAVYGDIEVLYNGNSVGIALTPIAAQFRTALRNFDDTDFLLPVGDPVLIGIASYYAGIANRGIVNFLRWDRQTRNYIKIEAKL